MATETPLLMDVEHEEARRCAVHALYGVPLENCQEQLWTALGDPSWRVRKEAIEVLLAAKPGSDQVGSLIDLLRDEDNAGLRNATAEVVVRLGKKSVPALLNHLQDADHDLRKLVVDALATIGGKEAIPGLITALNDSDVNVSAAAAEGLGTCGSTVAIPAMLKALQDNVHDFFRFNVLASLGKIGLPAPLPPIIRELASKEMLQRAVYECLGKIGGDAAAAEIVMEGLMSPLPSVRQTAIRSLAAILRAIEPLFRQVVVNQLHALAGQGVLDQLISTYNSGDAELDHAVVQLLALIPDLRAVPVFLNALSEERFSAEARLALQDLGEPAVAKAMDLYPGSDEHTKAAICKFLGQAGECNHQIESVLEAAMSDGSDLVRCSAVKAVSRLSGINLLTKVTTLLDDSVSTVRESALQTLRQRSSCDRELICDTAAQMLTSELPDRRQGAALLFAAAGDGDRLCQLMKDEDPSVREAAVRAVGRMRLSDACSGLLMTLVDEVDDVRIAAAEALGACCDYSAIQPLKLALQDKDSWVQAAALRSLVEMAGEHALPDVLELWQRGDEVAQLACLEAFDLLADPEGLARISQGLGSRDGEVLKSAIEILARHSPDLLQPWYQHIFSHQDWDVRMSAVRASCGLSPVEREQLLRSALEHEHHDLVKLEIRRLLDRG